METPGRTGREPVTEAPRGGARASARLRVYVLPGTGVLGVLLTVMGLSGVGDAPDPHDSSARTAAHFLERHDEISIAAALGVVAAALVGAFLLGLARRLVRAGAPSPAIGVGVGAMLVATYFAGLHLVYTSLSQYVAEASPETAKGLFVVTIMATPVFGAAVALILGSAAVGARRSGVLPAWWCLITAAAGLVAVIAVGSYADSGWFYPDVQQQVVGNILLLWLLLTSVVLAVRTRGARHSWR